jgi:hypothetical protein
MNSVIRIGVTSIPGRPDTGRWALRVPIRTLGKEPITGLAETDPIGVDEVQVQLTSEPPFLVATAFDFSTEAEAQSFLPRVILGLWHLVVRWNMAYTANFKPRPVRLAKDPTRAGANLGLPNAGPVHGTVEADATCVVPAGSRIAMVGLGPLIGIVSTPARLALPVFQTGAGRDDAPHIVHDEVIETALNLFISQFYEPSMRARFITLMMILEVFAPVTEKHPTAQILIRRWKEELAAARALVNSDQEALHALDALDRELDFRRETSIRQRVRTFVHGMFEEDPRQLELTSAAVNAYDRRGTLVHEGSLSQDQLAEAHQQALLVVGAVLRRRLGMPDA